MSTVREQLDEAIRRERELDEEYARVDILFRTAQGNASVAQAILGSLPPGSGEYALAQAEASVQLSLLESYLNELIQLSNQRKYNQQVLSNLRRLYDDPEVLASQVQAVNQAKAAAATKQLHDKAIAELPEAVARGQGLREEYERLRDLFVAARDQHDTLQTLLANLSKRLSQLEASNPDATQTIPSKADQARWRKDVERVTREQAEVLPQAQEATRLRAQYQMEALIAGQAYEQQEAVVRNLKQNRDDPEEQYHQQGARGGVFVPLGGRVF